MASPGTSNQCVRLFTEARSEVRQAKSKIIGREIIDHQHYKEDLLVKEGPAEMEKVFETDPSWRVRKTSKYLDRTSFKGEPYRAYYSTWEPLDRNLRPVKPITTIIMQHGFSRSSRYFHDSVVLLTKLGVRVITPDGANVASTLELSEETLPQTHGNLKSPSPVDDANTIREIIYAERLKQFVLLGHSRGHAVTALVAAMREFENKILLHFPTNPYTEWLNDFYIKKLLALSPAWKLMIRERSFANMFNMFKELAPWSKLQPTPALSHSLTELYVQNNAKGLRLMLNKLSLPMMKRFIAEALKHRGEHETLEDVELNEEVDGVDEIGQGLAGSDLSQPGFSILPLYEVHDELSGEIEGNHNGFGLNEGESSHITTIPLSVKQKTIFLYSMKDDLVKPEVVGVALKADGIKSIRFADGDHYLPSKDPWNLVRILTAEINKSLKTN